jgi:superfamily II DNA or RNA helicase
MGRLGASVIKLIIKNDFTYIDGVFHPDFLVAKGFHDALRTELSYKVKNVDWSPKYKEGLWDGLISLYRKPNRDRPQGSFPTGLISRAMGLLRELHVEFKIVDTRVRPDHNLALETAFAENGRELRFYQTAAVDRAMAAGRGILALATGAGKTITSCELLSRAGVGPFLFYVPALSLLKQTHREFQKYLRSHGRPARVGMVGGGVCDINPVGINVCTYQTVLAAFGEKYVEKGNKVVADETAGEVIRKTLEELQAEYAATKRALSLAVKKVAPRSEGVTEAKHAKAVSTATRKERTAFQKADAALDTRIKSNEQKEAIRDLVAKARGFIVDEAHLAAVVIETLGGHSVQAYYRWGLTGTPFREDNQEVRIEGTMGRKLIEISASDLADLGYLVPARVFMIRIDHIEDSDDYQDAYRKHITSCWQRNFRIKQVAEEFQEAGRPVLILVDRIEHGQILEAMIRDAVFVAGGDTGDDDPDDATRDYRTRMLDACEANEIVLIATSWAYTGVDAPAIATLILAGSNKSVVTTYQQVGRVLRPLGKDVAESVLRGKPEAVVVDFMDNQKDMHTHSVRRKKVYAQERAWTMKVVS